MFRTLHRVLSIILLLLSLILIVWAALPNEYQTTVQTISPSEMQITSGEAGADPLSLPARQVRLEWPNTMRIGEDETISLVFEPAPVVPGMDGQSAGYQDIYTLYNLMAEGRYDVAGVSVSPANPTRESMPAGQPVKFTWKVNAAQEGSYNGTVWLSLRYLPLDGGQASQVPIYINQIQIRATSLFGLNESMAYLLGGVGVLLAAIIVYDDLIAVVLAGIKKLSMKHSKKTAS